MSTTEPSFGLDAVDVLTADHRTVEQLFVQLEGGATSRQVIDDVIRELSVHAAIEEQILYPAIRKELGGGDEMAEHSLEEHQEVKELLAQLDGAGEEAVGMTDVITQLIQSVREHVAEEETEIFPRLRNLTSHDALVEMGKALEAAKKMAPTRPHPHAPNQPPGNVVAGAAAGLMDKARDALKGR